MLDRLSNSVTVLGRGDGVTYLTSPQFRHEDVGAIGATEPMMRFAVLRKRSQVHPGRSGDKRTNLIHRSHRGEVAGTVGAFNPVLHIVVLKIHVNMQSGCRG